VNPETGAPIVKVPDRPISMSPGQSLVDPNTGTVTGSLPERPVVVAPGSSIVDPSSGAIVFKAPDRPLTLAPGGALVNEKGETIVKLPERAERGLLVEQLGPDGKPQQVLVDPVTGKARQAFGEKPSPTKPSDVNAIRGQFLARAQSFEVIRDAYAAIERIGAGKPSPFGDMSLMYSYIKILDPNSAVREGEYATANNAQSVPDQIRTMYNRAVAGELLLPQRRADIVRQSRQIAGSRLQTHEQIEQEYRRLAEQQGLDPTAVVPDLAGPMRDRLKQSAAAPQGGRAATRAEFARARRDAKGNPQKALQILTEQGIDPNLDVVDK
jgi:hypothetical protein